MLKKVMIDILGEQGLDDQSDRIEFTTEGALSFRDGNYSLIYEEGQMTDHGKIQTRLTFFPGGKAVLERSGTISSRMEVEEGKRNVCFYGTPVGEICIGIFGVCVKNNLSEHGGTAELNYHIDSDLRLVSKNTVKIRVKEVLSCQK